MTKQNKITCAPSEDSDQPGQSLVGLSWRGSFVIYPTKVFDVFAYMCACANLSEPCSQHIKIILSYLNCARTEVNFIL